jgi:hypothetical protein
MASLRHSIQKKAAPALEQLLKCVDYQNLMKPEYFFSKLFYKVARDCPKSNGQSLPATFYLPDAKRTQAKFPTPTLFSKGCNAVM